MIRRVSAVAALLVLLGVTGYGQQPAAFRNFNTFNQLVPGIDFFASSRQLVMPYVQPAAETVERLKALLGEELPKGAIFICSSLKQKDSIYEPKVLRSGYSWALTVVTPEVRMEEMQERIKSQMGGEIPEEFLSRIKGRLPEMMADVEQQAVSTTAQQVAHAVIQTMLNKEFRFRSSRVDDMGKSPLPDWLDIGIASYASGNNPNLEYLQQNMDQTFPIEDILSMSRPFTASSILSVGAGAGGFGGGMSNGMGTGSPEGGFGGGGPMMMRGPEGGFGGGFPPPGRMGGGGAGRGGRGGGNPRMLPKDEQDRMLFDGQASTFFSFMLEKVGIDKMRQLIAEAQEGKESREFVSLPDVLGPDFTKTENEWTDWVKGLKVPQQGRGNRVPGGIPQERSGL